ncbi:MAG: hypothetical protein E6R07_06140 [Nevskiaceae bacterium]|nr:MAG: hypothetical protein E6R07_06140 [Nevskiaceae bacterium]
MKRRSLGISVLEVIVVMSIAGILAAVGIPSFISSIKNNRLTAYSNDFITGLILARTEAVKRNLSVNMCRSANATAATPSCTTGGTAGWEIGWFIYADVDGSNTFNAGDLILMRHDLYNGGVSISGNNNVTNFVRFTSQGITSAAGLGTITLNDGRPTIGVRLICIAATGRARIAPSSSSTCTGI